MLLARRLLLSLTALLAFNLTLPLHAAHPFAHGVDKFGHRYTDATLTQDTGYLPHHTFQTFQLFPFYAIDASGPIDLYIHGSKPYQSVTLLNDPGMIATKTAPKKGTAKNRRPILWVDNGVLYIHNTGQKGNLEPLEVEVNVKSLNALFLDGNVHVEGDHITSAGMIINDNSSNSVTLNGKMHLNWLNVQNSGNIDISWVDSDLLLMNGSGSGAIRLAGIAQQMRARLNHQQRYAGQYLRVKDLMVETQQYSAASVFAIDTLEAFAYGHSNIYYFHTPNSLNRLTQQSANVLQADWRL